MASHSSSSMSSELDPEVAAEVAQLRSLPHSYRDENKATLRARTNTVVEMIDLSMTTFAKMVRLPKKTVTMVLQNQFNPNSRLSPLIYARFAQFLYAYDARVVSSVVRALDPELNRTFQGLQDAPSEATIADMNPTEKAKALGQCLGNKINMPILDKLARNLLTHFQLQGADLTLSTVKSFLNLSTPLLSRAYLDRQSQDVLLKKDEPPEGWLLLKLADSNGQMYEWEEDEESGEDAGESRSGDEAEEDVRPSYGSKRTSTPGISSNKKVREDASTSATVAAAAAAPSSSSAKRPTSAKMEVDHSDEEDDDIDDDDSVEAAKEAAASRAKARKIQQQSEQSKPQSPFIPHNIASSSTSNNSSTAGVKRPRSMAAASAPRLPAAASSPSSAATFPSQSAAAAAASSTTFSSSSSTSRTTRPADKQNSQNSGSPYVPPIFVKATMGAVLVRMIQVLERDGFSRRQVAVQIGISQSKISRLLHGRSPFRTPEEEFHLRHWVYRQEKQWIAGLEQFFKRARKDNQELDFALLPPSLRAVDPQTLKDYLDFTLPLDQRKAVDKAGAIALGYEAADWVVQTADVETEEIRLIREADELAAREAMEDNFPSTAADSNPAKDHEQQDPSRQQQKVRVQRASGFGQKNARSQSSETKSQHRRREGYEPESRQISDESESGMSEEDERKEGEDAESEEEEDAPPRKKAKRSSTLYDDAQNSAGTDFDSENPSGPTCGLDAWTEVNYASARIRVQQLMSITNVSQTIFARLLEISSGTVSMILRGIFRFSSLSKYLGKLKVWGRATDQLLVTKALSILGADHHTSRDPISNPNQYPEAHLMREERKDDEEEGEGENPSKNAQTGETASQALEELAVLLSDADIPMENHESAMNSAASAVLPLSLWSWLNFRCDFHERIQLDGIMLTWVERWSSQEQRSDMDFDTGVALDQQQTESLDRFEEFLSDYCKGCYPPQAVKVH